MSNDIDILSQLDNIDLASVETDRPNLPTGIYLVKVAKMEVASQKAPKTGKNLNIQFGLVEPAQAVPNAKGESKVLQPGFPVFDTISLTKTFNEAGEVRYDPLPRLAKFREAVLGSKDGSFMPLEQYIGRTLTIKVKFEADSKDRQGNSYGPKSSVQDYVRQA